MKNEIKIILDEGASNKAKGNCFESLIRNLLSIHQYKIKQNIRFTGMELDLIAEHKHKSNEILYVECKAKDKVSSIELRTFFANVYHHKANFGYFFRTNELEFDAGGLLEEYRNDSRYSNLTFFEPKDIIEMLTDSKMIFEPLADLSPFIISKKILAVTYFGDYFIYLINESNALPTKFIVVNAKQNDKAISKEIISNIKTRITEIKELNLIDNYVKYIKEVPSKQENNIEAISEVQESENWYDYLPASSEKNHFVGRDDIRLQILSFFKNIRTNKTNKRIFYLNGKSGWGKSSLVLEIKGRCRNKHYKKKFYALAIDTRSAISDNFVALSLKKLIIQSITDKFIQKDIFFNEIAFTSNTDLLSSESMSKLLQKLKNEDKYLVLIFDQFEDVFRKKDFFKTFYKFLTDVTDKKPNIIVGFSWKTDFFIQSGDPSYHIWQQAKEQASEFTINEFGQKEIDGIIKQLEGSVGELGKSVKNRIIENSQGLPWLTKKLCIHIFDQIRSGLAKENLIESNLNISELFLKDEERLESKELKAIKLIAKRAYDSNFFDESEVGDLIDGNTITSLLHKRLIIRSGANYNIYWDIYRDYLVTNEIPPIGESYLLRQGVNLCLEVFLLFEESKKESIESLLVKHTKEIGQETLNNILIELRNLGLVQKENEFYYVSNNIDISKSGFIDFITIKFQNYTPYLSLKKADSNKISKSDVIITLKSIFKQEYQDNTWDAYAKNLINWIMLSNLDIKSKLVIPRKGRGKNIQKITQNDLKNFIPRSSLKEILETLPLLLIDTTSISSRFYRDLVLIDIIDENRELTEFGVEIIFKNEQNWESILKHKIMILPKMQRLKKIINDKPKIKAKELIGMESNDFFDGNKESSKIIYATKALTWLK
ncbi:MAG: AAA family ATPase [Bacteroidales bacterium]|nr:AAA family ATPase [Bacteroidales bacterium]